MTRKLQFLLTALLLMVGVTGAWAQQSNSVTNPTGDTWVRTDKTSTGYGSNNTMEMQNNTNGTTDFYGVMQFSFNEPEFGYRISSATLRLTTRFKKGDSQIKVYSLDAEVTDDSNYGDLETEITSALGNDPIASFNLKGYNQWAPTDGAVVNEDGGASYREVSAWQNTIDLTSYVKGLATNSFALLLEKPYSQNNSSQIFTKEATDINLNDNSATFVAADLKPQLTVTYEKIYAEVEEGGNKTYCTTLNDAFDAITSSGTITLYDDVTITSRCNVGAKTITVVPSKADISITSSLTSSLWLLNNTAGGNLTIGSDTYQLTIGGSSVVTNSSNFLETSTKTCTTLLNNVKFKNLTTTNNGGVVNQKSSSSAVLTLKNCAFENCTAPTDRGVVFTGSDEALILSGNNTFTNCSTYDIYLERRFKIDATNGVTNTTPIRIYAQESNIKLGNPVATQSLPADEARFFIMNKDYASYSESDGSSRANLTICEGKTLDVTAAEAATLVLPFAATIPEGVTCYTLEHTDGASSVVAKEVTGGTLAAETPVLVNATMGSYKFRNSSKATTATSIPESPSVSGALTGVYSDLTFTEDNIASTYSNAYILNKIEDNVGFYKAADGKKVGANRAYLTATKVPGAASARLNIVFEDETNGINAVQDSRIVVNGYYNLSGQRVENPTKGLYIVNGKKVIIK